MTFPYAIGDGKNQPNNRVLYANYKDSVIKGGRFPIPNKTRQPNDHGTYTNIPAPRDLYHEVWEVAPKNMSSSVLSSNI